MYFITRNLMNWNLLNRNRGGMDGVQRRDGVGTGRGGRRRNRSQVVKINK